MEDRLMQSDATGPGAARQPDPEQRRFAVVFVTALAIVVSLAVAALSGLGLLLERWWDDDEPLDP
jgi:hypothetical protein